MAEAKGKGLRLRVSEREAEMLRQAAELSGVKLGTWMREELVRVAGARLAVQRARGTVGNGDVSGL